jgi:hypothetical protein
LDHQEEEQPHFYMNKGHPKGLGKGKGKGKKGHKGGKNGHRSHLARPALAFESPKGKGKGKPPFKGTKERKFFLVWK